MASNPEPPEMVFGPERNGPVRSSHINRPDLSFGLKRKGRVIGILLKKLVFLDGQILYLFGE
jgi:hypothetical protein